MICQNCGTEFDRHPKANNQKYCPACSKKVHEEQCRAWLIKNAAHRRAYERKYYHDHKENRYD